MTKFRRCLATSFAFCVLSVIYHAGAQSPAFTILETPNLDSNDHLNGIAAFSPGDVWAVGFYTSSSGSFLNLAMHWNGAAWTITPTPNPSQPNVDQLKKLTTISSDNVWAIGGHGQSTSLRWDGTQWSEVSIPPIVNRGSVGVTNYLEDLVSTSSSDIWAVGSMDSLEGGLWTLTIHWNGTEWMQIPSPNKTGPNGIVYSQALNSAVAFGPNDVWAAGYYRVGNTEHTLVEHWDGTQWSIVASPDGPTGDGLLRGMSGSSPTDVWAVGEYQKTDFNVMAKGLTLHWNGTVWSVIVPPNPSPWGVNPLNHVVALAPSDAYAVGQWENATQGLSTYVIHWDGAAWTQISSQDAPGSGTGWNQLNDIAKDSSGGLWTAGSKQASFGSPTFSLVERSGAAAETDTVTIPVADYVLAKKQLRISATSTNPEATLTAYVTSSDALIGTLTKKPGRYTGQFRLRTNPQNITVKSSLGGTASKVVIVR
jgi:hypothetical protein